MFSMKRVFWILVALVGVSGVILGVNYAVHRNDDKVDLTQGNFPHKLDTRVSLRDPKFREKIRYVKYAADGITPLEATIVYENGDNGVVHYLPGAVIGDMTITRADGTLAMTGHRLPDGTYDKVLYFEDGKIVFKHDVLDKHKPILEETFRNDGSKDYLMTVRQDKSTETTRWFPSGLVQEHTLVDTMGKGESVLYYPDGVTAAMKADNNSYSLHAYYYDERGRLTQERPWTTWGQMTVTVYGAGNVPLYKQTWTQGKLSSVEILDKDGKTRLQYDLYVSGQVSKLTVKDPSGKTGDIVKSIDADGKTVEKIEYKDTNGWSVLRTEKPATPEHITPLSESRKTDLPHETPRIKPISPYYYGYGEYED